MKNALSRARPRSSSLWRSEAGQGTLEYVLVLVVSVLIILGVLYQFNSAFKVYVTSYFGEYVACLLEVGDLPGVASECALPSFDLKNGKKLITSVGSGGGSTSAANSSSSKGGSTGGTASGKSSSSTSSSSSSSGGRSQSPETIAPGGSSRIVSSNSGRSRSSPAGSVADLKGGAGGTQDDVLGISPTSTSVGHYAGNDRSRANNMSWGYYDTNDPKDKANEDKPSVTASNKTISQNNKLKAKSIQVNTTRTTASVDNGDDEGFSFGAMIRLLLIILMIVAIVVFFGGQILQISKSGE